MRCFDRSPIHALEPDGDGSRKVFAAHEMDPCYRDVELTEGVLMRDAADTTRQIAELRDRRVRISIDDLGRATRLSAT